MNSALLSSNKDDWCTPDEMLLLVEDVLGWIDVDPCSNSKDAPNVRAKIHFTKEDDGLTKEWKGKVYINPPYGDEVLKWVEKAIEQHNIGNAKEIILLVAARTDTQWFKKLEPYAICLLSGRLTFKGAESSAPFPSAVVYIGSNIKKFKKVFSNFGRVVLPEGMQPKKKSEGEPEEKPKEEEDKPRRAWGEVDAQLFFTVRSRAGPYYFATWKDNGIVFLDSMTMPHGMVYPELLPLSKDGEPVAIVGIPFREEIEAAQSMSPEDLSFSLQGHLRKYIDVEPLDMEMSVHYILLTWFYRKVPTVPYLRIIGDTGKGKSRILDGVADLCFLPVNAAGASTASGIMRYQERWHGTLRLDEADLRDGDATVELIKYLNLGFEKNRFFIKTDKVDPKNQEIFDPFGPKVIGMRQPFQDNATEARCLSIAPKETTRGDIPPLLLAEYFKEVAHLQGVIARFALENWRRVDGEKMVDLSGEVLEARIKQLAMPLSSVLQIFPDGEDRFREYVRARQKEVIQTRAGSWEGQLFNAAVDLATKDIDLPERYDGYMADDGTIQAVPASMIAKVVGTTPKGVTRGMEGIGFVVELRHITVANRRRTTRALVMPSESRWLEALRRYRPVKVDGNQLTLDGEKDPCPPPLRANRYLESGTHGTHGTDQEDSPPPPPSPMEHTSSSTPRYGTDVSVPSVPDQAKNGGCLSPGSVPCVPSVPEAERDRVNEDHLAAEGPLVYYKGKMISRREAAMQRILDAQKEAEAVSTPEEKERATARSLEAQKELLAMKVQPESDIAGEHSKKEKKSMNKEDVNRHEKAMPE